MLSPLWDLQDELTRHQIGAGCRFIPEFYAAINPLLQKYTKHKLLTRHERWEETRNRRNESRCRQVYQRFGINVSQYVSLCLCSTYLACRVSNPL